MATNTEPIHGVMEGQVSTAKHFIWDFDEAAWIRPRQTLSAGITATTSGNTQVVAAVSGFKIRVTGQDWGASAAITVKWRSGASTELVGGGYPVAANGGISRDAQEGRFLFETASGAALNINLSGNANVGGTVQYELVAG